MRGAVLVASLMATAVAPSVHAQTAGKPPAKSAAAACAAASLRGQDDRDHGKYLSARTAFLECAAEACPRVIQKDCADWLTGLDAQMPSVVLGLRDDRGNDVARARVTLDGAPFAEGLGGRAVAVDPGEHRFRFEVADGRVAEATVVLRVGEKGRFVMAGLPRPTPAAADGVALGSSPPAASADKGEDGAHSKRLVAFALAAGGVAALGVFAGLGISGKEDVAHLRSTCAPYCAQASLDAAKSKLIVADVMLVAGVASLGVGAYLFVSSMAVGVTPSPGGSGALLSVRSAF